MVEAFASDINDDLRRTVAPRLMSDARPEGAPALITRRQSLFALGAPLAASSGHVQAASAPFRLADDFRISGTFLNAAYTHPMPLSVAAAIKANADERIDPFAKRTEVGERPARALFARLINASKEEIAFVPSTSYGETFVAGALGLQGDAKAKIVTDILHFDGALYMYGELAKQGSSLTILPATPDGRIDMNRLEAAVTPGTRLVAISLVSMINGFQHDLKTVCEIAHAKGAHVFVDAIQGAGAVPIDVKASGVDFLACSSFKWLMGDFGCGFLYVRSDLLATLKRTVFGYHQPATLAYHAFPGDPPGDRLFEASPQEKTAAGFFEVGSTSIAAEIGVGISLQHILDMGVDAIQAQRQPLLARLRGGLRELGVEPLTPAGSTSPIIAYRFPGAARALRPRLEAAKLNIQVYANRFRVSPSVYNTVADIDRLLPLLTPPPA